VTVRTRFVEALKPRRTSLGGGGVGRSGWPTQHSVERAIAPHLHLVSCRTVTRRRYAVRISGILNISINQSINHFI